jgi:hypothetical protein
MVTVYRSDGNAPVQIEKGASVSWIDGVLFVDDDDGNNVAAFAPGRWEWATVEQEASK